MRFLLHKITLSARLFEPQRDEYGIPHMPMIAFMKRGGTELPSLAHCSRTSRRMKSSGNEQSLLASAIFKLRGYFQW